MMRYINVSKVQYVCILKFLALLEGGNIALTAC